MAASFTLDEDSLRQEPEEVFDLLDKLGEGYVCWRTVVNRWSAACTATGTAGDSARWMLEAAE
jgi:hypothetical protein